MSGFSALAAAVAVAAALGARDAGVVTAADCSGPTNAATVVLRMPGPTRGRPLFALRRVGPRFRGVPLYVAANRPEPSRLYVVLKDGTIRVLDRGRLLPRVFLDLARELTTTNEDGLLSLAFDPQFALNHFFYVAYNDVNGDLHVTRFESNGSSAVASSRRDVLFVDKVEGVTWHNGGQLQFGPDGLLYVSVGDSAHTPLSPGGAPLVTDPANQAQDLATAYGKILRLDVRAPDARPQVIAYGFRNPWRFSFDRRTRDLYIADVGFHAWEEIDYIRHDDPALAASSDPASLINFGWSACEGNRPFFDVDARPANRIVRTLNPLGRVAAPVAQYAHPTASYCGGRGSITGGYVYRGSAIRALRGRYVFGDFCSSEIWSVSVANGRIRDLRRAALPPRLLLQPTSFGEGLDGELYVTSPSGEVRKLVPVRPRRGAR